MLEALDADAIRRWSRAAVESARAHQGEIDALNVFPVADGDTGTNLALTLGAADDELREATPDTGPAALQLLADAAVRSARGNSGVLVSQLLRGLAEEAGPGPDISAAAVLAGLRAGAVAARLAVSDPVEGTILTVSRAAAEAPGPGDNLAETVGAAVDAAYAALLHTPEELAVLAEAGVVDAGARGYVLLLDALEQVITGKPSRLPADSGRTPGSSRRPGVTAREAGSEEFGYEVQYLVDAGAESIEQLRAELSALGDCVAIAGTTGNTWNVHVHVNDIGAAVEAGVRVGRLHRITVTRFADQTPPDGAEAIAVVAVAPGAGLAHLFEREGVRVLHDLAPSADDVLAAIRGCGSSAVVVLPNWPDSRDACEQAAGIARADGLRIAVVPTRSAVQGLAAVAVHDPTRGFDDDVVAMAEAAAATRYAQIWIAEEDSLTSAGICKAGDVLGMIDGDVVEIGRGVLAVVLAVVDRLLGVGPELITVLLGEDAPAGTADMLARHVRSRSPLTEVTIFAGGPPNFPVVIGVE